MPRSHLVEDFVSRLEAGVREEDGTMLIPKVSGTCDSHVTNNHLLKVTFHVHACRLL